MTSLEELLAVEREAVDPTDEERERVAGRVAAAIGLGVVTIPWTTAVWTKVTALPSQLAALWGTKAGFVGSVAALSLSLGLGASYISSAQRNDTALKDVIEAQRVRAAEMVELESTNRVTTASPTTSSPATTSPTRRSDTTIAEAPPLSPDSEENTASNAGTPSSRAKTATTQPEVSNALLEDARLLSRVTAALNGGKHQEALRLMKGVATRTSPLASEFTAARAVALCGLGRQTEGKALVAGLLKRAPESPALLRVKRACSL